MRGVEETALAFDRAARATGVEYALVGGMAVLAWGQPRATADIDALMLDPGSLVPRFGDELRKEGFDVDVRDFEDARADRAHVTLTDPASGFHVHVKLAQGALEEDEVRRARDLVFRDGRLRIVAPEETIAFELLYASPQDLQDARSLLIRQEGRLDLARLRDLARRLEVERALDELMRE